MVDGDLENEGRRQYIGPGFTYLDREDPLVMIAMCRMIVHCKYNENVTNTKA